MNNDVPKNGDFAAYLESLGKQSTATAPQHPEPDYGLPAFQASQELTFEEKLHLQELAELPPVADDDLLTQALATAGDGLEYGLDGEAGDDTGIADFVAQASPQDKPEGEQVALAFLGEHTLNLANQARPEELNELPPISEEELIQQALASPADEENSSPD
ncbi:hypothetical protein UNDYM_3011 [Undibacterium sp. YM2]|uniref:hypothetical protein n=1 Tax=Undibacterium sp. YM2 TaxID=2058625 RepID=UPI001331EEAD|nr:hypothetical protein [Undibacterium sp. YM2]BBB67264.1 hypothetical protein UNDYM_3011 [Undibacterium sp. YM2]